VITLHPMPELRRRVRLNHPQARNFKATPKKEQAEPAARDRGKSCECARRSCAESC
jgi:hypothetical protein